MWEFLFLRLLGIDSPLSSAQMERLGEFGIARRQVDGLEDLNGKRVWDCIKEESAMEFS